MTYNIDANVFESPYSLFLSILLCLGVLKLGNIIQYSFIKNKSFKNYKEINYCFSPIVGTYSLILFLYFIFIFELNSKFFLSITSYILVFLAIISFKEIIKIYKLIIEQLIKNKESSFYLLFIIYILHFFIATSPITHADAIDYHFSGSLNLLNFGHFHKEILPMNNTLVSLGELIMSLGLSVKAEQFSSLIQFLSLIALIPFFNNKIKNRFFLIFILICPITFFLISSYKPQLLFSVSSLLIFIFLVNHFSKTNLDELKKIFPIVLIILCINSLAKYSFHLSSLLLVIYFFYLMKKRNLLGYSIFVGILIFSFLYLPYLMFRHQYFDTSLIDLIKSPLPTNLYGYQSHHDLISGGKLDILNMIFPKSILAITSTYGPLIILCFLMINKKVLEYKIPISLIIIFIVSVFIFGGNLPRFLFEGFLWLVFIISIIFNKNSYSYKIFSKVIYLQLIFMIPIYLFFIIKIFPGSINDDYKKKVMLENANGYELASWANKKLDKSDILLSSHRSISLFKNKTYSDIFTWHIDLSKAEANIYLNFLKSKKINRILFYINEDKKKLYKNCIGKKLFFKKNAGKQVGRNPFRSSKYYSAWIYEFNYEKLPDCIISSK